MLSIRRVISLILALALFVGMVPLPAAHAAEPEATVDSGAMTVEGTNEFGALLSENLQEELEAQETSGAGSVIGLTVSGSTATVEYSTTCEAVLLVALYSEDGLQLLASGKTTVIPEETEATVTIEGTIPEYFMASAYLLDSYDYSPLGTAYDTPVYTREMQELLASTVADYPAERVLNLDSDDTTNFAVYAEGTIVIEEAAGVNTVTSADSEARVYTFANPDDQILGLEAGDIFAYAYGEAEIILAKVSSVSGNGTSATVYGDELEIDEIFSHVKLEGEGTSDKAEVDDSTASEGVTYLGHAMPVDYADGDGEDEVPDSYDTALSHSLSFDWHEGASSDGVDGGVSLKSGGAISLGIDLVFSFYKTPARFHMELKTKTALNLELNIVASCYTIIRLPRIKIPIASAALSFVSRPTVKLEMSGKVEFGCSIYSTTGFSYDTLSGFREIKTSPALDMEVSVEGTFSVTFDLEPGIMVIKERLVDVIATIPVKLTSKVKKSVVGVTVTDTRLSERHACKNCLEFSNKVGVSFSVELELLDCWKFEKNLVSLSLPLGRFAKAYHSLDGDDDYGWGECPRKEYKVAITVQDASGRAIPNLQVMADGERHGITDLSGSTSTWLASGNHTLQAAYNGETGTKTVTIASPQSVTLCIGKPSKPGGFSGVMGEVSSETVHGNREIVEYGTWGTNVTYTLDSNGLVEVSGTGEMSGNTRVQWINPVYTDKGPYYYPKKMPTEKEIKINAGITQISAFTGIDRYSIEKVTIPETVVSIGDKAFDDYRKLNNVTIPGSVVSIGAYAFDSCGIDCDKVNITISDGVQHIGDFAFDNEGSYAGEITELSLPASIKTIGRGAFRGRGIRKLTLQSAEIMGEWAFSGCMSLTNVIIGDGVVEIGRGAFRECENLSTVSLGNNLERISSYAFSGCNLTNVVIPDSVKELGGFDGNPLTHITIPEGVTLIGEDAFAYTLITEVTFPDSVKKIGYGAFSNNDHLSKVIFRGDAPTNGEIHGPNKYVKCYIPEGNTTWGVNWENGDIDGSGAIDRIDSGGWFTWISYTLDSEGNIVPGKVLKTALTPEVAAVEMAIPDATVVEANPVQPIETIPENEADMSEPDLVEIPVDNAVVEGAVGSEMLDTYTLYTARFFDVVPGEQYLLLSLASNTGDDLLALDNLLAIDQATADEDGNLVYEYVQRVDTDASYVVACGPSNKNLKNAAITLPELPCDGEAHAVRPTVTYAGKTLTEGEDYTLHGDVSYTEPGDYTIFLRGIYNYTGVVKTTYRVEENTDPVITRIAGSGRVQTALESAKQLKTLLGVDKFQSVVVADARNFPDALSGSYLAAAAKAPILLYADGQTAVTDYIKENLASGGRVYILGGANSVSSKLTEALPGITCEHVAGSGRFGTSLDIIRKGDEIRGKHADKLLVCTGASFADSLSASATGLPILLVNGTGDTIRDDHKAYLETLSGVNIYVIGGTNTVNDTMLNLFSAYDADGTVERVSGSGRAKTSVEVAKAFFPEAKTATLALSTNFPDGLSGGPVAYTLGAPMLLISDGQEGAAAGYVSERGIKTGYIFGGTSSVSDTTANKVFGK